MTPQSPTGEPSAGDSTEHATARTPRSGAAASSFDAAQELLQAALDGVRTTGAEAAPSAPQEAPGPPSAEAPIWAAPAAKPARAPERPPERAPEPAESTEFWAKPVPTSDPAARTTEPVGKTRPRRRRPAAPVATSSADDFDGLTDTLYQPTTESTRRRRRPETGTAAAIGTAAAVSAVAPKAASAPVTKAPTQPSAFDAPAATAPATAKVPQPPPLPDTAGAVGSPGGRPTAAPGTAAWEQAAAQLANPVVRGHGPSLVEETDQRDAAPRRRTAWVVAAAIAAVVAVVALGLVMTGGGGSDQAAVVARGKAQLRFAPITTPEGATVTRSWELEGRKGSDFVGTLSFSNPTSAPLLATFTEVIPKSLATNVSQITFDPQPVVVKADPVVQYRLTVPAGSSTTATYTITVAPEGVDRSRLEAWAKDLPLEPTTTTTTTTVPALFPSTEGPTVPTSAPGRTNNSNNSNNSNNNNNSGGTPNRPTNPPAPAPTTPPTSPPEPPPTSPPEPPPTNPPVVKGTVVIQVITRGSQSGTFGYSTPVGAISLTTSGGGASWSTAIDAGSYTLAQISTPDFFYLYEIRCSNGFASSHTTTASITVPAGETVSCTFENRPA